MSNTEFKFCKAPFVKMVIHLDGKCYICCPSWNKNIAIGNIFEQSFDEVWYGEKAMDFRRAMMVGIYKYCDLSICPRTPFFNPDEVCCEHPPYPDIIELSYSCSCNVRCITCRDKLYVEKKEETARYDTLVEKLLPVLSQVSVIFLNGLGELFTSTHFRHLISKVSAVNKKVKYDIITNGVLCDRAHFEAFGLLGKTQSVQVSLHSASKKVYDKIVLGGNFNMVIRNLKWLAEEKKKKNIDRVFINFVVSSLNYMDLVDCVKFAKNLGIIVQIWCLQNWNCSELCKHFDDYTVWNENHPEHQKFVRELGKLRKFKKYYHFYDCVLSELQNAASDGWFTRCRKFLFKHP